MFRLYAILFLLVCLPIRAEEKPDSRLTDSKEAISWLVKERERIYLDLNFKNELARKKAGKEIGESADWFRGKNVCWECTVLEVMAKGDKEAVLTLMPVRPKDIKYQIIQLNGQTGPAADWIASLKKDSIVILEGEVSSTRVRPIFMENGDLLCEFTIKESKVSPK
jgi:hypothetical protein